MSAPFRMFGSMSGFRTSGALLSALLLTNTPLPAGGSPRRMSVSSRPSDHRTLARALIRLYPPLIGNGLLATGVRIDRNA